MDETQGTSVCVRNSFIDFHDTQTHTRRSNSYPPSIRTERDTDALEINELECKYLASWLERSCSPLPLSGSSRSDKEAAAEASSKAAKLGNKRVANAPLVKRPNNPKRKNFNDEGLMCGCGAFVQSSSYFCHRCGGSLRDAGVIHDALPTQKKASSDLGELSIKAYEESKLRYSQLDHQHCHPDDMVWRQEKLENNSKLDYDFPCDEDDAEGHFCHHMPKDIDLPPDQITTLMICDIPCRMTITQIVEAINEHGFSGTYDLVYMPSRPGAWRPKPCSTKQCKTPQNMGYAFVNFKESKYADEFGRIFQHFAFPNSLSSKLTYTKPAHAQGFHTHMKMHTKQRATGCLLTFHNEKPAF